MQRKLIVSIVMFGICTSASIAADTPKALSVTSTAIAEGVTIPKKYTKDGDDVSPPLSWSKGPDGTKSYAIDCEDPDAPGGTWWHWIMFNLAPEATSLAENQAKSASSAQGVLQGSNDFHKPGYNGPAPPAGKVHHYYFKVMALDTKLSLSENADKDAFKKALKGHVLAEGRLTGVYKR